MHWQCGALLPLIQGIQWHRSGVGVYKLDPLAFPPHLVACFTCPGVDSSCFEAASGALSAADVPTDKFTAWLGIMMYGTNNMNVWGTNLEIAISICQ